MVSEQGHDFLATHSQFQFESRKTCKKNRRFRLFSFLQCHRGGSLSKFHFPTQEVDHHHHIKTINFNLLPPRGLSSARFFPQEVDFTSGTVQEEATHKYDFVIIGPTQTFTYQRRRKGASSTHLLSEGGYCFWKTEMPSPISCSRRGLYWFIYSCVVPITGWFRPREVHFINIAHHLLPS